MKHTPPPQRIVQDSISCTATYKRDRSLTITATAESATAAKVEILDKIGWRLIPRLISGGDDRYVLLDADDLDEVGAMFTAPDYDNALDQAFNHINWDVSDPSELIGGGLTAGFSQVEE